MLLGYTGKDKPVLPCNTTVRRPDPVSLRSSPPRGGWAMRILLLYTSYLMPWFTTTPSENIASGREIGIHFIVRCRGEEIILLAAH